jgi:hypothetical protein
MDKIRLASLLGSISRCVHPVYNATNFEPRHLPSFTPRQTSRNLVPLEETCSVSREVDGYGGIIWIRHVVSSNLRFVGDFLEDCWTIADHFPARHSIRRGFRVLERTKSARDYIRLTE